MGSASIFPSTIDSKFIHISLYHRESQLEHAHQEIELIYVIKGGLKLLINNKILDMKSSDFVMVNSNAFHSFQSPNDNLFVTIQLDYSLLSSLLGEKNLMFFCSSIEQASASDMQLRMIIVELLTVYMKQDHATKVEFLEKTFKLVSYLLSNYLRNKSQLEISNPVTSAHNERLTEILGYMQTNYREPLSLEVVASLHYMSIPYLSKYFKQQTGKTFSQYLNEIRLAHAVNELVNSNKLITRIALDNGFPNLTAFNRVFNEYYQMKPVEYRKQKAALKSSTEPLKEDLSNREKNDAFKELSQYLNHTSVSTQTYPEPSSIGKIDVIKVGKLNAYTKFWNKMINIGYALDILNSDMQEQILLLQKEIGFSYARFWGLFSDDMRIEDGTGDTIIYNFSNVNKLLDFLVANKLKPFIELGPKPKVISKKINQNVVVQPIYKRSFEEWKNLTRSFLLHCMERYGIEEVETWYFEIWKNYFDSDIEDKNFLDNFKKNKHLNINPFDEYFKLFNGFKEITKEILPSVKVGGCGLSMDIEGDRLDLLLQQWKLQEYQPDFLSVYLYPIEIDLDKKRIPIKNMQSSNPNFVKDKLNQVNKSLKKAGFDHLELIVTEWNISFSNRDYLNDSCFKSAYLTKNIIEAINQNQVHMMGYWLCSDIFSDFRDTKNLLHGGAGLITKSGIKKPGYHAFALLQQLGENLVAKGSHYILTKKSGDRYQLLCFNYKHFKYSFYLQPEGSVGIEDQYDIFENTEELNFSLEVQGITNGKYRVKEIMLNRTHGSVLDEWLKFGALDHMKQDEVEYLKQICVPFMKVEHTIVDNQSIVIQGVLQPHEVRLFEITPVKH